MHFEEIKLKDTLKEWRDKINRIIVHNKSADFLLIESDINLDYEQHNGRILLFKNDYKIYIPNNINSECGFKCTIKNVSQKTLTIIPDTGVYINDSLSEYTIKNNESITIGQYSSENYYIIEDANKSLEDKVAQEISKLPTTTYVDNQDNKRLLISSFNDFKTNTFDTTVSDINSNIDTRVLKTDFDEYKNTTNSSILDINTKYDNLPSLAKTAEYSDILNVPDLTTIEHTGSLETADLYTTIKYKDNTIYCNLHNSNILSNKYDDLMNLPSDLVHQQNKQEIVGEKIFTSYDSVVTAIENDVFDIDIAKGRFFTKTITENCTLRIINTDPNGSNPSDYLKNYLTSESNQTLGTVIYLRLITKNDDFEVTWGNDNLTWDTAPVLEVGKNYTIKFITFDSGVNWIGSCNV